MKSWAVIVAAGKGERAGFGVNKVYQRLNGRTVLETCLEAFDACGLFEGVTVVISPGDEARFDALRLPECVKGRVFGGETRQESVFNGLQAIPDGIELVAVHDAARPYVTKDVIEATLRGAEETGSGVISTPMTDTVKQVAPDGTVSTPERSSLFAVQTPQTFRLDRLLQAHLMARWDHFSTTDDAALYERYYGSVHLVTSPGASKNKKLTYREDFMTQIPDFRVGHGFDAHRLVEGRKLILCGVDVPYEKGLDGHSDADVALHALMDAMLGAAALGDIGRHFPDKDDRYLGISSLMLLDETVKKLAQAGYRVSNADVTIIAQRPKLASYIETMRNNVAGALSLDPDRVNVKATTTEHMGYEGAGEGISSHAVVMIVKGETNL